MLALFIWHICLLQFGFASKLHLAAETENKAEVGICGGGIYKQHKLINIC